MISTAVDLHYKWKSEVSKWANLTRSNQSRFLMRIVTLKHLQILKKSDRPVTVIGLDQPLDLEISASPMHFHGNLACEAFSIHGINRSLVSRSRAKQCILQQKFRAGTLDDEDYSLLYSLSRNLDQDARFNPSSITVLPKAVIDKAGFITFGDGISGKFKYHLQPINECEFRVRARRPKLGDHIPKGVHLKRYAKVFVASKLYVWSLYHDYIEAVCRILPYIKDLSEDTEIAIHVGSVGLAKDIIQTLFGSTEFPDSRFISGAIKADIALFPTPSESCYFPGVFQINLFRFYINRFLGEYSKTKKFESVIIVIKRSKTRKIVENEHNSLVNHLRKTYGSYRIKIFDDISIPNLADVWELFHSAAAIIAPHGMGLANIVACRPRTVIIEMLAYDMPTLCFAKIAQSLDFSYHGIVTSRNDSHTGTITVNIPAIMRLLNLYEL